MVITGVVRQGREAHTHTATISKNHFLNYYHNIGLSKARKISENFFETQPRETFLSQFVCGITVSVCWTTRLYMTQYH